MGRDPGGTRDSARTPTRCSAPLLGLATAVVLGYLIYRGALRINLSKFFTWTGAFLIVVAAGVLAYGVHDLQEAGILPGLNNLAFDVSRHDPARHRWYGTLLKGIFNFSPATTWLEAVAWLALRRPDDDALPASRPPPQRRRQPHRPVRRASRLTRRPPRGHPHAPLPDRSPRRGPSLAAAARSPPAPTTPPATARATAATTARARPSTSTDDDVRGLGRPTAPSGNVTFEVTNTGDAGHRVLPARRGRPADRRRGREHRPRPHPRPRRRRAAPGTYFTACKPGMIGDGIRADFTVTDSGDDADARAATTQELIDAAPTANYAAYVQDQTDQLVAKTQEFAAAYTAGDDDEARALYPDARVHWERIETVAESFGDLDPKMDLREADLEPGQEWTGWHRIEKDLWPRARRELHAADAERAGDVRRRPGGQHRRRSTSGSQNLDVHRRPDRQRLRGLLDEVATGKVTGEEEYWSHTDLWDFQANVDGARVGFEGCEPLARAEGPRAGRRRSTTAFDDAADAARRAARRRRVRALRRADARTQIKELSDAVNALGRAAVQADRGRRLTDLSDDPTRPDALSRPAARSARLGRRSRRRRLGPPVARRRRRRLRPRDRRLGGEPRRRAPATRTPFHGAHQAGIVTPAQDRLHFAAFDVTTDVARRAGRAAAGLDRRPPRG